MPAFQNNRQPEPLDWFSSARGSILLEAEESAISGALVARPAQQPWLWLAPAAVESESLQPPPGSLRLHRQGAELCGSVRCTLPLPLSYESIGNIIVQHVLDEPLDGLLDECARVLEPGGRLFLFTLNPWSPYRARWAFSGLQSLSAYGWQQRLANFALTPCATGVSYLGPVWRGVEGPGASDRLRAVCLLQVEKRTTATLPASRAKAKWQPGAAPA